MGQFWRFWSMPKNGQKPWQWDCLFFHFLAKTRSNILDKKWIKKWNSPKSPIFRLFFSGSTRSTKNHTFSHFLTNLFLTPKNDHFFAFFPYFPVVAKCSKTRFLGSKWPILGTFWGSFSEPFILKKTKPARSNRFKKRSKN